MRNGIQDHHQSPVLVVFNWVVRVTVVDQCSIPLMIRGHDRVAGADPLCDVQRNSEVPLLVHLFKLCYSSLKVMLMSFCDLLFRY
jgi:hypothetical protein